jgi:hypothetical protein
LKLKVPVSRYCRLTRVFGRTDGAEQEIVNISGSDAKEMDIQSDNRNLRSSEQQCVLIGKPIESGRNKYSKNSRPTPSLLLGCLPFSSGYAFALERGLTKRKSEMRVCVISVLGRLDNVFDANARTGACWGWGSGWPSVARCRGHVRCRCSG